MTPPRSLTNERLDRPWQVTGPQGSHQLVPVALDAFPAQVRQAGDKNDCDQWRGKHRDDEPSRTASAKTFCDHSNHTRRDEPTEKQFHSSPLSSVSGAADDAHRLTHYTLHNDRRQIARSSLHF